MFKQKSKSINSRQGNGESWNTQFTLCSCSHANWQDVNWQDCKKACDSYIPQRMRSYSTSPLAVDYHQRRSVRLATELSR